MLHRAFDNDTQAKLLGEEQYNSLALPGYGKAATLFILVSLSSHFGHCSTNIVYLPAFEKQIGSRIGRICSVLEVLLYLNK